MLKIAIYSNEYIAQNLINKISEDINCDTYAASDRNSLITQFKSMIMHMVILDSSIIQDSDSIVSLLHEIDPTSIIIVTTKEKPIISSKLVIDYGKKNVVGEWLNTHEHICVYVSQENLVSSIEYLLRSHLRMNHKLYVEVSNSLISNLTTSFIFRHRKKPTISMIYEEFHTLLQKLFLNVTSLSVEQINKQRRGNSRAFVYKITFPKAPRFESLILKFGEIELIYDEIQRYNKFVRYSIRRAPRIFIEPIRTRYLLGFVYENIDGQETYNFKEFFTKSSVSEILNILNDLFFETLHNWHDGETKIISVPNMRDLYFDLLHLPIEKLRTRSSDLLEKLEERIDIELLEPLDPVEFAINLNYSTDTTFSVIHGDLGITNIFIDETMTTKVFDFAYTDFGPVLLDFCRLEISLLIEGDVIEDISVFSKLVSILYSEAAFNQDAELESNEIYDKTLETIRIIRTIASKTWTSSFELDYLVGTLYTSLRLVTVRYLKTTTRYCAYIMATIIAKRLSQLL